MLNTVTILQTVPSSASREAPRWSEIGLWLSLFAVLLINLPAFLCLGLDPDALQWDLGARTVLQGGVPYRDWLENNLPGMLWIHALTRSLLGWRSEVMRMVDLLIVLTVIGQLTRWLPCAATRKLRLGMAGVLLIFYLSTSEWCHCQRDVWMLLPALGALSLRLRQVWQLYSPAARSSQIIATAFTEGLLWGVAVWIKPFVMIPAFLCWLLSARLSWQAPTAGRKIVLDGVAVICGGLTCGAAGIAWLSVTGAWPAFAEVVFVWNRQYVVRDQTAGRRWLGLAGFLIRFFPWILIHLFAIPQAIEQVWSKAIRSSRPLADPAQALLSMLYLGWLFQACCLQHVFDYVHVPCFFLALTVFGGRYAACTQPLTRRLLLALLLVFVLARFPSICRDRLLVWKRCLRDGSTAALRDHLTLLPKASWSELADVQAFLRHQGTCDGELSCTHMATIALYHDLNVRSATRFLFLQNVLVNFRRQRDAIFAELAASRQRFLVCDVEGYGMEKVRRFLDSPASAPYVWSDRIVFRSGRYVVFRLSGAETSRWFEDTFTP